MAGLDHRHRQLHPHPQFCADNEFVAYTTTVRGEADFALTRTADLIAATS